MKRILLAASFAALLLSTSVAFAGGKGNGHGNGHGGHDGPPGKHKGWHKQYKKGERIETVYLAPRYYIDHHHHRLSAPPPGHRWVRHPDGRLILVAVATGIIADILLHH